ncbi:DUF6892 domain-containing protein [Chitinophaga polysaccharea]|uniref:DUF6892 domain-containing protein n=1 Tax=Chitinophaga polysaccharea TaxID=1293035 RepID=UPI001B3B249C|nr:hypothetical protein [Chitinophaga polysaccharea]
MSRYYLFDFFLQHMQIVVENNKLVINGKEMTTLLSVTGLQQLLGDARHTRTKHNHVYTWDEWGMVAYSKNDKEVDQIELAFQPEPGLKFSPAAGFTGEFVIEQIDYRDFYRQHKNELEKVADYDDSGSLLSGGFKIWFDVNNDALSLVSISTFTPPPPKVYSDKYRFRRIDGKKIEFKDFNFKLAVIQVLMYEKKILQPVFDLYDFIQNYEQRVIDIEKEGYHFIAEVTAYFEALEIDEKYANEVTEISQDAGNEIYRNMRWFWDGEDDTFNIKNFEDVRYFNNLRKMSLFYTDNLELIKAQLTEKNVIVA